MKIKRRNNLVKLIFVHLLLLAYPLVSKTIHVHHGEHFHHEYSANICFNQHDDSCPVCDFEFYNFVPSVQHTIFVSNYIIPVYDAPTPSIGYKQFVNYLSLRAPPVA